MSYDVEKPDEQWRAELTPAEYAVLRQAGTEPAFTGEYTDTKTTGVYSCRACGAELFTSTTKFESHCGWRRTRAEPDPVHRCSRCTSADSTSTPGSSGSQTVSVR